MKKILISTVSVLAMGGLAYAQTAKGSGAAGATAGAGVTAKAGATTGAGAGSAAGGAKARTATPPATPPAGGQTPKGGAAAPVAPPAPMEMPKPPAEIAAAAKMMAKTKTCTGTGMGPDMKTEVKLKSTMSAKLDANFGGWWIRQNVKGTVGEGKTSVKMNLEGLMTYDAKLAKWRFLGVSSDGGSLIGMADMKDGKYELVGERTSPMGTAAFKDHGDMTDPKNVHLWGEMSIDKGKTWIKVYDQTCK